MKKIVLFIVFAFVGIVATWAQALPFKDNGSVEGKITKVEVTNNVGLPLTFIRGSHVYFTVEFEALTTINGGDVDLEGYFFYQGAGAILPVNKNCLEGGPSMIKKGDSVKYLIRVNIPKDFPLIYITINLVLKNKATGNVIISFNMPVLIKDA